MSVVRTIYPEPALLAAAKVLFARTEALASGFTKRVPREWDTLSAMHRDSILDRTRAVVAAYMQAGGVR